MTINKIETLVNKVFEEELTFKGIAFSFMVCTWHVSNHPKFEEIDPQKNESNLIVEKLNQVKTFEISHNGNERLCSKINGAHFNFDFKNENEFNKILSLIRRILKDFALEIAAKS